MKFRITMLTVSAVLFSTLLATAEDWPQWRGPFRTDISPAAGLLKEWPEAGPKLAWTYKNAGLGYSSFAIVDNNMYTMGTREQTEYLLCLDANTGKELWATEVGPFLENGWGGGPRSTPAVDGDYVYTFSGQGHLACLEKANGKTKWNVDVQTLGGKIPKWGYSESVLIDGEKILCTPGADDATVVAFNKANGEVIWKSAVTAKSEKDGETEEQPANAHYSSIMPAIINGDPQYVQLTQNTLFGLQAGTGEVLWQTTWPPGRVAVIPTPLIKDNYVYITSGYGAGCKLVKINKDYSVEEVYFNTEMKNHHGGVILLGDTIYGHSDAGWLAQDFMTGEEVWRERQKLGKGSVTFAEGNLYCLDERTGTVALVSATRDDYIEKGRFDLPEQSDIRSPKGKVWTHPVVINGKLYLRDQEYIFCYDVSAK
ncbi:MAG: PQQ-like beta-propeller repeat protein [Planctomycetaceae bacterium]|jgi:outer membrane protein assembly factor BamB|nr:PQQ-like beta-propeller repeat protein [Planctomycetaceae bacterium]